MTGEFGHWPKTSTLACCIGSAAEPLVAYSGGARSLADENADATELLACGGGGERRVTDDDADATLFCARVGGGRPVADHDTDVTK